MLPFSTNNDSTCSCKHFKEAMQWKSIVDLHVRIVLFTSALMEKLHGFASGVIMLSYCIMTDAQLWRFPHIGLQCMCSFSLCRSVNIEIIASCFL